MKIESIKSEMKSGVYGSFTLTGRVFENVSFKDFSVNPKVGTEITIENCTFTGCKVTDGAFVIMKGSVLKNVSFIKFDCGKAMHISAEAILENVKIAGTKAPKMIWIRPQEENGIISDNDNLSLDISEYEGEVSITGFPVDRVKINPDNQVIIRADLLENVDWQGLGLSPLSYWKMMAKKASVERCEAGVFSMPPKSGRNYERSIKELSILREKGFL